MSITFNQISKCFSGKSVNIYFNDKINAFLNDAKMIAKNQTFFANDVIYIGKTSILQNKFKDIETANLILINDDGISIKDFFIKDLNIIEFKDSEDIFEIYNLTKDFFTKYIEVEHYTATLFKAYMLDNGLDYIVKVASEMLNNPVIVIDLSYKVIAYSNVKDIKDYVWLDNIKKGYCSYEFIAAVQKMKSVQEGIKSDQPYEVMCNQSSILKLISKVKINNKHIGDVILLECNIPILPRDKEILEIIAKIVAEEMKKNSFYRNTNNVVYEDFIYDLLESHLSDRYVFEERMKSVNLKFGKKLSVLVFDISRYKSSGKYPGYLRDNFSTLVPSNSSVYYKDNIVSINNNEKWNINPESIKKLKEFLTLNSIYLGISREFSDIVECRKYYLQAMKALEIGELLSPENPFTFYCDIQLYDLLSSSYNHMDYNDFCNPALIKLKEYDGIHNSDLYYTLFVYLKNNQSIQKTSQELFIHRNTMRYKLQKILHLTYIDFSNIENVLNIYVSYKITSYLDEIKGSKETIENHNIK